MFGPLNIIASSAAINLLLSAHRIQSMVPDEIRQTTRRLSRRITIAAAAYSAAACVALAPLSLTYAVGVRSQLFYAFPVTAACSILSAQATATNGTLRALAQMRSAFYARLRIVAIVWVSAGVGIALWLATSIDPLILPVLTTGVAANLIWRGALSTALKKHRPHGNGITV